MTKAEFFNSLSGHLAPEFTETEFPPAKLSPKFFPELPEGNE
jgi:hypothetical protein